jgi:hypothetical protein
MGAISIIIIPVHEREYQSGSLVVLLSDYVLTTQVEIYYIYFSNSKNRF